MEELPRRLGIGSRLPSMAPYFVWYMARGATGFFIPLYLYSIGLPVVEVGIALGFSGAGVLVFEATWGYIIDRVGVARTLPGVEAVAVITFLLFQFVSTPVEAYAASFLLGATAPVMVVVGRYLVVGESESSGWGAKFGMLGAAISLGFGVGALVGGLVSSRFGYGYAFDGAALLSLVPYPLYAYLKNDSVPPRPAEVEPQPAEDAQGLDWRTLSILSVVSVPLFMGSVFYTSIMQLVVTQTPSIGANSTDAAIMISLYSFSNVVFQPLLGAAFGGRARKFITLGLALNLAVFLALTQAGTMLGFDALAVAEAFCFSMVSPLSLSLLMVRTPRRYAGRIMGMYGAAEDVGIIVGPVVGAFVWANFGLQSAYLAIAVPLLAALLFFLVTSRQSGRS
jgi:predicted MFS family arabinose efflux permease